MVLDERVSQVQAPLGYFDPLGLSKDGDFAEPRSQPFWVVVSLGT